MDGNLIFDVILGTTAIAAGGFALFERGQSKHYRIYLKTETERRKTLEGKLGDANKTIFDRDATIRRRDATIDELQPDADYGRDQRAKQKAASEAGVKARLAKQAEEKAAKPEPTSPAAKTGKPAEPVGQLADKRPVKRRPAKK